MWFAGILTNIELPHTRNPIANTFECIWLAYCSSWNSHNIRRAGEISYRPDNSQAVDSRSTHRADNDLANASHKIVSFVWHTKYLQLSPCIVAFVHDKWPKSLLSLQYHISVWILNRLIGDAHQHRRRRHHFSVGHSYDSTNSFLRNGLWLMN